MRIAVLGATGATGRQLVGQALERGHEVVALARDPRRLGLPESDRLHPVAADVTDPQSVRRALAGVDAVLSGLGKAAGGPADVLARGAQAVTAPREDGAPPRVVWLAAYGTGRTAEVAGATTRGLLRLIAGAELPDRTAADEIVLRSGGSVLHAGRLTDGAGRQVRTVDPADAPRRLLPGGIPRAAVAAAMLAEAEQPRFAGRIGVPLGR